METEVEAAKRCLVCKPSADLGSFASQNRACLSPALVQRAPDGGLSALYTTSPGRDPRDRTFDAFAPQEKTL